MLCRTRVSESSWTSQTAEQKQSTITMPRAPASLLHAAGAAAAAPTSSSSEPAVSVDSDMVVILASFLCALICVLGLALVSRCACRRFRRRQQQEASSSSGPTDPPPKGLKKKAIDALPTVSYPSAGTLPAGDCAICLVDFGEGEALRVLPRCGHAFHVDCVDAWLRTRATCPSCRAGAAAGGAPAQPAACGRCGSQVLMVPTTSSAPAPGYDTFLP